MHLISHGQPLINSSWTIGCSVDVRLHEYREGTPSQRAYFIELWDVGGNNSHKNARHVFYNPIHGKSKHWSSMVNLDFLYFIEIFKNK